MQEVLENEQNECKLQEIDEMRKYPPIDISKLVVNPFSQTLVVPATKWTETGKYVIDEEGISIPSTAVIEKAKSTKVYHSAERRNIAMGLSPTALKLFTWIIYDIEDGNDWVRVMPEMYAKHGGKGASRTQLKKAVDELIRYGYVCMTQFKNTYWVNPAIIYPGSRINKYPDKVIVKNEW